MPWSTTPNGATFADNKTMESRIYDNTGELVSTVPFTQAEIDRAARENAANTFNEAKVEYDRAIALTAPEALEALQLAGLASEGFLPGALWRQPTGAHDAYPEGTAVSHKDKQWTSLTPANVWEPGVSGWREVTEEPEEGEDPTYPEFIQPTGAHDAYKKDDIVTFEGKVYKSILDSNTYSPSAYPAGWQEII